MNALMIPMIVLASPIVRILMEALFVSVGLALLAMAGPLELDVLVSNYAACIMGLAT